MANFDLSMNNFLVPGLRNYQPKVGKMKSLGVSLTTLEVVNNMATPYTRVFTMTDGDTVSGPVEADCTVIYRTTVNQQLDLTSLKGSPGVKINFILEGTGSLELVLTSGLQQTTYTLTPQASIAQVYTLNSGGVQTGWVVGSGGSGGSSGGVLTRTFTREAKSSEDIKSLITDPETFFAGYEGKDVSVVIRSGDYTLTKPYKDAWFWFKTEKFGTITVVCEDNVLIRLSFDFSDYDPIQDGGGSSDTGKRVYFYTPLGTVTSVNWYGGGFTFLLAESTYTIGTQSTGGGGGDIEYNPFGTLASSTVPVFGIFGNEPDTFNGVCRITFDHSHFLFAVHDELRLFPVMVFDTANNSSNSFVGSNTGYGNLIFTQCVFLNVSFMGDGGSYSWPREYLQSSVESPATVWLTCNGGSGVNLRIVPVSSPILTHCIVQNCFTSDGGYASTVGGTGFGDMPGYLDCRLIAPRISSYDDLSTLMNGLVSCYFPTLTSFETLDYWSSTLQAGYSNWNYYEFFNVKVPVKGGVLLTSLTYSNNDVSKLEQRLSCGNA